MKRLYQTLFAEDEDNEIDNTQNPDESAQYESEYEEMMENIKAVSESKEDLSTFDGEIKQFYTSKKRPMRLEKTHSALITISDQHQLHMKECFLLQATL